VTGEPWPRQELSWGEGAIYINPAQVAAVLADPGGGYRVVLADGTEMPVSEGLARQLTGRVNHTEPL
jgi:hypothetical protein